MEEQQLELIVCEVRSEFQIPPYFPDAGLMNYAIEGKDFLSRLNPNQNLEKDSTYRMLLKNYIYYAFHHKINEFQQNYHDSILNWQLTTEVSG